MDVYHHDLLRMGRLLGTIKRDKVLTARHTHSKYKDWHMHNRSHENMSYSGNGGR